MLEDKTAGHKQSGGFLEGVRDNLIQALNNFLIQANQHHALLDLLFRQKEEVAGDVVLGGRLSCSNCEIVKLKILRRMRKASTRVQTLGFRRADFALSRSW